MIGVPDPRWDERPLACVVVREGSDVDRRRSCCEFLAEHVAQVAAARAVDLHRRGAEDERRQVRQEGAPRPVRRRRARRWRSCGSSDRCDVAPHDHHARRLRLRASRRRALAARARVRASRCSPARSSGACSACAARSRRPCSPGPSGWVIGVVGGAAGSRPSAHPASDGFARNLFLFSLLGAMAAAVWLEFLARPGIAGPRPDRPAVGPASGPLARAGAGAGCSGTPRSPASRCATGSARRSASAARTMSRPAAAARRSGACVSRSRSAAGCS